MKKIFWELILIVLILPVISFTIIKKLNIYNAEKILDFIYLITMVISVILLIVLIVIIVKDIYTFYETKRIKYIIKQKTKIKQLRVTYNDLAKLYQIQFFNFTQYKQINEVLDNNTKLKIKTYLKYKEEF